MDRSGAINSALPRTVHVGSALIAAIAFWALGEWADPPDRFLLRVAVTPDGQRLAQVDNAGRISVWDRAPDEPKSPDEQPSDGQPAASDKKPKWFEQPIDDLPQTTCLVLSPDGKVLIVGGEQGLLCVRCPPESPRPQP